MTEDSSVSTPSEEDDTTPEEQEPVGVRPGEVVLFLIFGIVPIAILYTFASQGMNDTQGQQFEQERRLEMVKCMKDLDDREECRGQVDRMVLECYDKYKVKETGAVTDRVAFNACISRTKEGTFKMRTKAEKKADADAMKAMRE